MGIEIINLKAFEILDSRGKPTVKTYIELKDGTKSYACVPSGASVGKLEAIELRDGDENRYFGKGVLQACQNVSKIELKIKGKTFNQLDLDNYLKELDGTNNYSNLGANAVLSVSLAFARAYAMSQKKELYQSISASDTYRLPTPMLNIINGGAHAKNNIDFQEFMIVPIGFDSFRDKLRASCEVYKSLRDLLIKKDKITAVGDEGGFAPDFENNIEPIEYITNAIKIAGYNTNEIKIALDAAASSFFKDGKYRLDSENRIVDYKELTSYYKDIVSTFPIISIEDGFDENDWEGFAYMTKELGDSITIVGDDIFVTNSSIFQKAIDKGIANSILIKPNQIGTLSETIKTINLAKNNNYSTVISHRSGETEDSFIADLSVSISSQYIKTGAPARGERVSKYNRLLEIEEIIKGNI